MVIGLRPSTVLITRGSKPLARRTMALSSLVGAPGAQRSANAMKAVGSIS